MKHLYSYKYRLVPTPAQEVLLAKHFGCTMRRLNLCKWSSRLLRTFRYAFAKRHRDIADCGFYSFVQKLCYKALWYGRKVVKVSRWFPSSQLCHHCGWRYHNLAKTCKEWMCWNCWEYNKRDHNAACNILDEGLRILTSGTEGLAACPDVRPAKCGLLVGAEAVAI